MAEQKLIQGTFIGRVGGIVGQIQKGQPIIKSTSNGIVKTTKTQKKAVRAFECLNRLASAIAKQMWDRLNLSDKTMHKHNAVAQWLKPTIADKIFNLTEINQVIPLSDLLIIDNFIVNQSEGVLQVDITRKPELETLADLKTTLIVIDGLGFVYHIGETQPDALTFKIKAQLQKATKLHAFYIITYTNGEEKLQLTSNIFTRQANKIIENEIWYTSRMKRVSVIITPEGTVKITGDISIQDETIKYNTD